MTRQAIQRCMRCRGEVPLEDTVWIDGSGAFCEEDGEGKPYCYSCVPQVEVELIRAAKRRVKWEETFGARLHWKRQTVLEGWLKGDSSGWAEISRNAEDEHDDEDTVGERFLRMLESRHEQKDDCTSVPPLPGPEQTPPDAGGPVIERVPEAEMHYGVELRGLHARVDDEGDVRFLGEVAARSGATIDHDLEITLIGYDAEGQVLAIRNVTISAERFFALAPISVWLFTKKAPTRVRVFPRRV